MTGYLVADSWAPLAVLLLGGLTGYGGAALFSSRRPGWSRRRRVIMAALIAPLMIAIVALSCIGFVLIAARPGDWHDIVVGALLQAGTLFGLMAAAAGLATALLAVRRQP